MAIRTIVGATGVGAHVTCHVAQTFQSVIALGDMVAWSTSANFAVNSCADNTNVEQLGQVKWLNGNSSVATVEFVAWHGPFGFTYSGTAPALGSCLETAGAHTSTVNVTSNTTLVAYNRIVGTDAGTTQAYAMFR